ncbi:helix-turn-helix domain-containing protein [Mycetocola sp. JXN-3]|uniref:winged helix-turn-helix transcriptional regulator n=1 Tax=Mycetocola sp. JXN-3 TaxID=2116510 RepID=UPI00165D0D34|nr:helix-turn-helix domain-containing protein [Mycetocola sp. JXN-3]
MALGTTYDMEDCAIATTLDIVGERWTLLIISHVFFGLRRYTDIRTRLGVSPAMLTQRLNRLIEAGILARTPGRGVHEEYTLTPRGEDLWPVVSGLAGWGNDNGLDPKYRQDFTHARCGTVLDRAGFCPACTLVPPARDVVRLPRPVDLEPAPSTPASARRLLEAARP